MKVKNGMASSSSLERIDAEHAAGNGLHERHGEIAEVDRHEAEEETDGGQREGHRVADDHEDHQPGEHERRHPLERNDHCVGLS